MIRCLADEDFNHDILRGLVRRVARLDILRVQDIGLRGADDDTVLGAAAAEQRVLLTHDVSTLIGRACRRVAQGQVMPGVIAVLQALSVGMAIDDLVLIVQCSLPDDWRDQVWYLPLR
jgi:hypothetical protein